MTSFSLQLPDEVAERLRNLAKRTGRTETYFATEAICQYIQDLEDLYISEKRMEELDSGVVKPMSLDDLNDDVNV